MSASKRVQQWLTFSRQWWLYDAKWQDPYKSALVIKKYLRGEHKPIYTSGSSVVSDCGDHVVVINSSDIALKGDEWFYRVYFHHTGYPGGATWTKAYELHQKDPTMILWKAVYKELKINLMRRQHIARLHIFKDDQVPEKIMENITNQIRPVQRIPKRLGDYSKEDIEKFPKLWDYPKDYVIE